MIDLDEQQQIEDIKKDKKDKSVGLRFYLEDDKERGKSTSKRIEEIIKNPLGLHQISKKDENPESSSQPSSQQQPSSSAFSIFSENPATTGIGSKKEKEPEKIQSSSRKTLEVLEKATSSLKDIIELKNDIRHIQIWIEYVSELYQSIYLIFAKFCFIFLIFLLG